jgi:hypothetical protein
MTARRGMKKEIWLRIKAPRRLGGWIVFEESAASAGSPRSATWGRRGQPGDPDPAAAPGTSRLACYRPGTGASLTCLLHCSAVAGRDEGVTGPVLHRASARRQFGIRACGTTSMHREPSCAPSPMQAGRVFHCPLCAWESGGVREKAACWPTLPPAGTGPGRPGTKGPVRPGPHRRRPPGPVPAKHQWKVNSNRCCSSAGTARSSLGQRGIGGISRRALDQAAAGSPRSGPRRCGPRPGSPAAGPAPRTTPAAAGR